MSIHFCDSLKRNDLFSQIKKDIEEFYRKESINLEISDKEMTVFYENEILKLKSNAFSTVYCDFTEKSFIREVRQSYGRSEGVYSFLRPISKNRKIKILDMTVGMGRDFFKFALAGHQVVGFERNPVFYHLVRDGLRRFVDSPEIEGLKNQFRVSDFSIDLQLGETCFDEGTKFDLIYYDPMFEDKSKKAAPKKGMQALKYLNHHSEQDEKNKMIERALKANPELMVFKCSGVLEDFPFTVKKEHKGKGFSYVYL